MANFGERRFSQPIPKQRACMSTVNRAPHEDGPAGLRQRATLRCRGFGSEHGLVAVLALAMELEAAAVHRQIEEAEVVARDRPIAGVAIEIVLVVDRARRRVSLLELDAVWIDTGDAFSGECVVHVVATHPCRLLFRGGYRRENAKQKTHACADANGHSASASGS